jgi:hypothetical protein
LPAGRRHTFFTAIARVACLIGIFLIIYPTQLRANKTQSNLVCREDLPVERRNELASKLRKITGWPDLKFDRSGPLRIGNREAVGGSKSARELVASIISGTSFVVLEDASQRSDVAFCRVVPGRWKEGAANRPPAYVVLIDFADFERLTGDERALDAFDVGWGLLHELDHILNDSLDAASLGETGECEGHINQMRRECNLPQRGEYFFTLFPLAADDPFITRLVRLAFDQEDAATNKKKRYWLIWDARLVGGLEEQKIATLR